MSEHNHRITASGQGLIEAVAGMALLVSLLLLVVIIGKYQAVDLAAVHAAREVTFDCAVLPHACQAERPDDTIARRVRENFTGTGRVDHFHQALWTTRRARPLLEKPGDAQMLLEHPDFDAGIGVAGQAPAPTGRTANELVADLAGPGRFGLDIMGGLMRARIEVGLLRSRGTGEPAQILDGMPLKPRATAAILADSWNASGPHGDVWSVHARVDKGWRLGRGIETTINAAYTPTKLAMRFMHGLQVEDRALDFNYHEIDMDIVPPDRTPATARQQP